ncbi:hypothetical protein GQ53DRAFT_438810 [Thozetella sp. PMI_491]|nr:hypothetical protein GQ53DRAFT_438810 [Thozetella sp. PMI_491]
MCNFFIALTDAGIFPHTIEVNPAIHSTISVRLLPQLEIDRRSTLPAMGSFFSCICESSKDKMETCEASSESRSTQNTKEINPRHREHNRTRKPQEASPVRITSQSTNRKSNSTRNSATSKETTRGRGN